MMPAIRAGAVMPVPQQRLLHGSARSIRGLAVAPRQENLARSVRGRRLAVVTMKLTPERKAEVLTVHLRRNLGQGDMGSEVTRLQEALVGYGELAEKNVTGFYGPLTERAVKRWQAKHELPETGYWGPSTRALHNRLAEAARDQLKQQQLTAHADGMHQEFARAGATAYAPQGSYYYNTSATSSHNGGVGQTIGSLFGSLLGRQPSTAFVPSAQYGSQPAVSLHERGSVAVGAPPPLHSSPSGGGLGVAPALGLAVVAAVALQRLPQLRAAIVDAGNGLAATGSRAVSQVVADRSTGSKLYTKLQLLDKPVFRARDVGLQGSMSSAVSQFASHANDEMASAFAGGHYDPQQQQHQQQSEGQMDQDSGSGSPHPADSFAGGSSLYETSPTLQRRNSHHKQPLPHNPEVRPGHQYPTPPSERRVRTTSEEVELAREMQRREMLENSSGGHGPHDKTRFWQTQQHFQGTPQINYGSGDASPSSGTSMDNRSPRGGRGGGGGGGYSPMSSPPPQSGGGAGYGSGSGGGGGGGGGSAYGTQRDSYYARASGYSMGSGGLREALRRTPEAGAELPSLSREAARASAATKQKKAPRKGGPGKKFGVYISNDPTKTMSFTIGKTKSEVKNGAKVGGRSGLGPPSPTLKSWHQRKKRATKEQQEKERADSLRLQEMVYELERRLSRAVKEAQLEPKHVTEPNGKQANTADVNALEKRLSKAESLVENALAKTDDLQQVQTKRDNSWARELQQLTEQIQAAQSVAESVVIQNARAGTKSGEKHRTMPDAERVEAAVQAAVQSAVAALEAKVATLEEQGVWSVELEEAVQSALAGHSDLLQAMVETTSAKVATMEQRTAQLEERVALLEAALAAPPAKPAAPRAPAEVVKSPIISPTPPPSMPPATEEPEPEVELAPLEKKEKGSVMDEGEAIFLQGFNWESHNFAWFNILSSKAHEIAQAGFAGVWMPPSSQSLAPQGYLPSDLYCLDSSYGSETDLRNCIANLHENGLLAIADIVINHRSAPQKGRGGAWNRYDGQRMAWGEWAITTDNPHFCGTGNRATGDDFPAAPNIDHTNEQVQKDLSEWLNHLRHEVGYDGWRFDFAKGYGGEFVRRYIEASNPLFAVGEYWDSLGYSHGALEYDQGAHRQRTVDWVDRAGGLAQAFDFTTKGILQDAVRNSEYWRLKDHQGKPPGVMGLWPSRAMTFLDNHDTGSTQSHWPFPGDKILQGYAYILTHPGMPCVMWDHFFDWGEDKRSAIEGLIRVRREAGVTSRSEVQIDVADGSCYGARIDGQLAVRLGGGDWHPGLAGGEWAEALRGEGFFVWKRTA